MEVVLSKYFKENSVLQHSSSIKCTPIQFEYLMYVKYI